ncbi:MAG: gamma carbonic anhydrase family protein [Chloroflexi bacterium]|nr:gamma carbonic anhydrase family protein [Chloroflexota bacterium]
MPVYEFEGNRPTVGAGSFVHAEAVIIGDVVIGEGCYIAAGAVLRGDWGSIRIGNGCNIQENCVLHAGPDAAVLLEDECHIGHGAIIHQAHLGKHVLVGMGAIVQDRSYIGEGCIIGAGCVMRMDSDIPPRKIVVGVPGEIFSDVSEKHEARAWYGTRQYQALPARYRAAFKEIKLEEI